MYKHRYGYRVNDQLASKMLLMPNINTQETFDIRLQDNDILIGCDELLYSPIFISFNDSINQHIFVFGMSGSGKTFLVKTIVFKLHAEKHVKIAIIDFTGEFSDFVKESRNLLGRHSNIDYFDMRKLDEKHKMQSSEKLLLKLANNMRMADSKSKTFIILDEAWKLIGKSNALNSIMREGRKYNTGLVLASQIMGDLELGMLTNVANLFVFRTNNEEDIERLSKGYNLDSRIEIKKLDIGSCVYIRLSKTGLRRVFKVKKVFGTRVAPHIWIKIGGYMIEIDEKELEDFIKESTSKDPSSLLKKIIDNEGISLSELITELILIGSDRRKILRFLRDIKISEDAIADAFSAVIGSIDEKNR